MRKLLVITLFLWTTMAHALEPLLVMHLWQNLRVVLSQETQCDSKPGQFKASAQRMDGMYIPGCWYVMKEHPDMVHIDWHNGDYSELPLAKFEEVELD